MPWAVAAATIGGALISSDAVGDASDSQAASAAQSDATNRYMYDKTREDNMPALNARNWALDQLKSKLSGPLGGEIKPGDVANDPGYQFGLNEGLKAQGNQLGARGMRNSGAALKAASRYGTDYATTKYDNAFNRIVANRSAQLNPLQSLAGYAQTGASTVADAGQNLANNLSSSQINRGNVLGASSVAQGNIWGSAVNQLGSAAKGWRNAPSSPGSSISNGQIFTANISSDPIGSLGTSAGWWE
jgi:hypothetical protein